MQLEVHMIRISQFTNIAVDEENANKSNANNS